MPLVLTLMFGFLTLVAICVKLLSAIATLQRKEYRLDRLRAALSEHELTPAAALYIFQVAAHSLALAAAALPALVIVGSELMYRVILYRRVGLYRPQATAKAILTLALAALTLGFLTTPLAAASGLFPAAAASVILTPPAALVAALLANRLTSLRKRQVITAAAARRAHINPIVIAITGSYGKTSVKHFLGQLLPHAAVSAQRRNEQYVIAQDMLRQLTSRTTIYVVEHAAYRRGEITALAHLTRPTIAVITAIGNQHLALFGSKENIAATKWELIEALPPGATAVLNADDPILAARAKSFSGKIIWFSLQRPADVSFSGIRVAPECITARLTLAGQEHQINLPLLGRGALANTAAALAAALAAGADTGDLMPRLSALKPFPQTMTVRRSPTGATVLDDSYSANEPGVIEAIEHLRLFPQPDKRIVLSPLIELGADAVRVHEKIGEALARSRAHTLIYGRRYRTALQAGARRANPEAVITSTSSPAAAAAFVTNQATADTAILLENRLPDIVRRSLWKNNSL